MADRYDEELTLEIACKIADAAVRAAKSKNMNVSVAVIDRSGNIITMQRMDKCLPMGYPKFAIAKANTCVTLNCSSREFRDKYAMDASQPAKYCQLLSMSAIAGNNLAPFPGGVLISDASGNVLGAVGVSGGASDDDEFCACYGIQQSGLVNCTTKPPINGTIDI